MDLILCGRDFVGVGGKSGEEADRRPSMAGDWMADAGLISGRLPEECFFRSVGRGSRGEACSELEGVVIGVANAHWLFDGLDRYTLG